MKYRQTQKPIAAQEGTASFSHEVQVQLPADKYDTLIEFLTENFGAKHQRWRTSPSPRDTVGGYWYFNRQATFVANVRFRDSGDAMRFKLSWNP